MLSQDIGVQNRRQFLQSLWADSVLFDLPVQVNQVVDRKDPIQSVLYSLLTQEELNLNSLSLSQLSLEELCQFALLYGILDLSKGKDFGKKILKFSHFPSFRCPEHLYDETKSKRSIGLLQKAFGKLIAFSEELDPYFAAMNQNLPCFEEVWQEPAFNAELFDE